MKTPSSSKLTATKFQKKEEKSMLYQTIGTVDPIKNNHIFKLSNYKQDAPTFTHVAKTGQSQLKPKQRQQ